MKLHHRLMWAAMLGSTVGYAQPDVTTAAESAVVADSATSTPHKNSINFAAMQEYAIIPRRKDVLVIDLRSASEFTVGHIPVAINIDHPLTTQDADKLPVDKNTVLIFYCAAVDCALGDAAATQAVAMGYSNVKVYVGGYQDWISNKGHQEVNTAYVKDALALGKATIVDARPPRKYKDGHVPGAINVPATRFAAMVGQLPGDKGAEIVFYCGGYDCPLSVKAADQARALGYTNLKLYQEGYPAWKKQAK